MEVETKTCTKCRLPKPLDSFSADKNRPDGKYPYCKPCRKEIHEGRKDHAAKLARKYRVAYPAVRLLAKARQRAIKRGVPFSLTLEDVVVPDVCPVLGIPLAIGDKVFGPNSPTLDRLRSDLGYEPGNVAVISFRANLIKNNATAEEVEQVAAWMRKQGL